MKANLLHDIRLRNHVLRAGETFEVAHVFFRTNRKGVQTKEPLLIDILWFDGQKRQNLTIGTDVPLNHIILIPDTALEANLVKL